MPYLKIPHGMTREAMAQTFAILDHTDVKLVIDENHKERHGEK
jgi:hypothetical protein